MYKFIFIVYFKKKTMNNKLEKILAEISAGELADKITILEIKKEKITDSEKLKDVEKELLSLNLTFKKTPTLSININTDENKERRFLIANILIYLKQQKK